ncbi:hypothetical protein Tco_0453949 [Tanacetum coccineum]
MLITIYFPKVTLPSRKRLCIATGPKYEIRKCSFAPTARPTRGFRADYGFVGTLDAEIRRDIDREVGYGITNTWDEMVEAMQEIAPTTLEGVNQRVMDLVTTIRQDTYEIGTPMLAWLKSEARASHEAWVQPMEANDTTHSETQMVALQSQLRSAGDPSHPDKITPKKRTIRASPATTTTTTPVTNAQFKALINQGVANALAARDTDGSQNVDDSHNSEIGSRRTERTARECTYTDFLKCQPMNFKGLKELMFLEESDNIEKYVRGLPDMIHGSVMASKPKTMQDAVKFATELMDKKIHTFAERQTKNKRKFEDTSRNNQNQQQQNKWQNTGRAYTARPSEKREYGVSLPKCSKCNYHHNGPCALKCHKCNKVGHLARVYKSFGNANTGHNKRECPKLKNNNHGNQGGNGNAPAKVYVVGNAGTNPDSNVVTGTFLLNNHYASILFDIGANRSFVSTAFGS